MINMFLFQKLKIRPYLKNQMEKQKTNKNKRQKQKQKQKQKKTL